MCDGGVDPRISRTRRSYDEGAVAYCAASASYARYPGLSGVVDEFVSRVPPGRPVLDAGCGTGRDSAELARRGLCVVSLDLSEPMLAAWPRWEQSAEPPRRVLGDMAAPPLRPASFGGVWACASLLHQPREQLPATVRALAGLLVSGGTLIATWRPAAESAGADGFFVKDEMGPRWETKLLPAEAIGLLREVGLDGVTWRETGGGWYAVHGAAPPAAASRPAADG